MIMIDHESHVPLYAQLAQLLRDQISEGKLRSRVPSIKTLAQEYEVSTRTAETALRILKDEGVLVAEIGKGYYVAKDKPAQ